MATSLQTQNHNSFKRGKKTRLSHGIPRKLEEIRTKELRTIVARFVKKKGDNGLQLFSVTEQKELSNTADEKRREDSKTRVQRY